MEGECPRSWGTDSSCKLVSSQDKNVKLSVNNVLKEIRILNVFGVIKGFEEPGKDPWGLFVWFSSLKMWPEGGRAGELTALGFLKC